MTMKKLLLLQIVLLAGASYTYAQELIQSGDMENEAAWTVFWRSDATDVGTTTFGYIDDRPSGGSGGCLSICSYGQTGAHVYQPVVLTPGNFYTLTGFYKTSGPDDLVNAWVEVILSRTEPPEGSDYQPGDGDYIYAQNVWKEAPYNAFMVAGWEGTFEEHFEFKWVKGGSGGADSIFAPNPVFILPDTVSVTTWYVVIKAGMWADAAGDESQYFNMLFDNVSLFDHGDSPPSTIDEVLGRNNAFTLYPNPTDGLINIATDECNLNYEVYDNVGALVATGNYNSSAIDLSNLNKGGYYISITSKSITETHKIVLY